MAVTDQSTYFSYIGDGVVVTFPYLCRLLLSADLVVKVDGVVMANGSDYTLTGVGVPAGGAVVFAVAPAAGAVVELERIMEFSRATTFQTAGDFKAEVVNADLDRLSMICQQLKTWVLRCFRAPVGEDVETIDAVEYANRAGKVLGYNSLGKLALMAVNYVTSSGLFTNPWADVRGYDDLAAAVAALGGTSIELIVPNGQAVSDNLTIPENIQLTVKPGGLITVAVGKFLTILSQFSHDGSQCFSGNVIGLKLARPEWFKVNIIPNVTNMTDAFQLAINSAIGGIVEATDNYNLDYNTIILPSSTFIDGKGVGNISNSADTSGKVFFYATGKINITVKNLTFTTPSSYQAAALFLNCSYVNMSGNTCNNCGLIETGSSAQTAYLLGGYYDGLAAGIYAATDGTKKTSHVQVKNNVLIGDGVATTLADTRRPGVLLAYTDNAEVSGNQIDGYIHGIMWWGGDAGPTVNGASGNERKSRVITITGNNINGTTAGGNIWGSMGDTLTITGNQGGYSGDVGIDFEGCTNATATGNTMHNRTNGGLAFGSINDNITASGNTLITDTADSYIVNIFGTGSDDNKNINIIGNSITALGDITAYIATGTTQYRDLTIKGNKLTNIKINLPYTNRNTTITDNKFHYTWNVTPAIAAIAVYGFENVGYNTTSIKRNIITSDAVQTANNVGFYSSFGATFANAPCRVDIHDNDFAAFAQGWNIGCGSDNTANAANVRFDIRRNAIGITTDPVLILHASGTATAHREGNFYDSTTFLAYPYNAPVNGKWFAGERTYTSPPASGGYIGTVCTSGGVPGTWKNFGGIL